MHIQFERTGGFAGMHLNYMVNTDSLPQDEIDVLQEEIEEACFFDLPAKIHDPSAGNDRFEYQITIRDGAKQHSVVVGDAELDDALRPLVQHLEILARTRHI